MHDDGLFPPMGSLAVCTVPARARGKLQKRANGKFLCLLSYYFSDSRLFAHLLHSLGEESYYDTIYNRPLSSFPTLFSIHRTIDHVICTFNLPTEFKASGQEHIIDEDDKVKIKVDPMKMSLDGITTTQLEEIVDGWMKFITRALRDAIEKVRRKTVRA